MTPNVREICRLWEFVIKLSTVQAALKKFQHQSLVTGYKAGDKSILALIHLLPYLEFFYDTEAAFCPKSELRLDT